MVAASAQPGSQGWIFFNHCHQLVQLLDLLQKALQLRFGHGRGWGCDG
jgi:hypothetical protein